MVEQRSSELKGLKKEDKEAQQRVHDWLSELRMSSAGIVSESTPPSELPVGVRETIVMIGPPLLSIPEKNILFIAKVCLLAFSYLSAGRECHVQPECQQQ